MREIITKRFGRMRTAARSASIALLNEGGNWSAYLQDAVKAHQLLKGLEAKYVDLEAHDVLGDGLYQLTIPGSKINDAINRLRLAGQSVALIDYADTGGVLNLIYVVPADLRSTLKPGADVLG